MNWRNLLRRKENSRKETNNDKTSTTTSEVKPKYPQPKILLLDLESGVEKALQGKGYNTSTATLGTPYQVPRSRSLSVVERDFSLPYDYKEHEIVVLDLHYELEDRGENLHGIKIKPGVDTWWVNNQSGEVNPRLLNASFLTADFDRILRTGGVFIIFADRRHSQEFLWGHKSRYGVEQPEQNSIGNWDFLRLTKYANFMDIGADHGTKIDLSRNLSKGSLLAQFLSKYLDDAIYDCTFAPGHSMEQEWISLLENKFGNTVGCEIVPKEDREGFLFVFPNIFDKATFVLEFIDQILPAISPKLFPLTELAAWINLPEYELTEVQRLKKQIVEVRQKAHSEIQALEQSIQEEKEEYSFLYDLIRESGDTLVEAVIKTLAAIGFRNIINVDEELAEQGIQMQNREDLQIHDNESTLLAEVKGINNYPSDEDALTVQKYVVLRMREWERVLVQGITIVNHQRHLPPLERENAMPFRLEILDVAKEQKIGLMTTWDLHRLAKSFIENKWMHESVRDLFYQSGRIYPVPTTYEYVGTIQRYIEEIGVVGIEIEDRPLWLGDRMAFELPVFFEEQDCSSMQFENNDINEAQLGMLVGIKTHLTKKQARLGTRVYRIITTETSLN